MNKHVINRRKLGCGCLGFVYVGSWAINQPTTIKNESDKIDSNKVNTFLKRGTNELLVVLVQEETS